jgi:hypothetical protein
MTPEYPHVPAAFINAIAEEGTKAEAVEWLQKQWNETCYLRQAIAAETERCARIAESYKTQELGKLDNPAEWPVSWTENLLDQIAAAKQGMTGWREEQETLARAFKHFGDSIRACPSCHPESECYVFSMMAWGDLCEAIGPFTPPTTMEKDDGDNSDLASDGNSVADLHGRLWPVAPLPMEKDDGERDGTVHSSGTVDTTVVNPGDSLRSGVVVGQVAPLPGGDGHWIMRPGGRPTFIAAPSPQGDAGDAHALKYESLISPEYRAVIHARKGRPASDGSGRWIDDDSYSVSSPDSTGVKERLADPPIDSTNPIAPLLAEALRVIEGLEEERNDWKNAAQLFYEERNAAQARCEHHERTIKELNDVWGRDAARCERLEQEDGRWKALYNKLHSRNRVLVEALATIVTLDVDITACSPLSTSLIDKFLEPDLEDGGFKPRAATTERDG